MKIELIKELEGKILDIGGGGEGIIARLYTNQVIAIDNRQDELDEAPDCCTKILMDATDLKIESDTFDHVTFFYSLMYMNANVQEKAISEAYRVLKQNGKLWIWDVEISSAYPEPFATSLSIHYETAIQTTYSVVKRDGQSIRSIGNSIVSCGFQQINSWISQEHFCMQYRK